MSMRVVAVDLSKPRHSLLGFPVPEEPESGLVPNCLPEGQLGSRKETHSHLRFIRRGEAAGNQVMEPGGYELITDFCRPGRDVVQTVVTHGRYSSCCNTAGRVLPAQRIKPSWRSYVGLEFREPPRRPWSGRFTAGWLSGHLCRPPSHSRSLDQRRRPETLRTAMATAFF